MGSTFWRQLEWIPDEFFGWGVTGKRNFLILKYMRWLFPTPVVKVNRSYAA